MTLSLEIILRKYTHCIRRTAIKHVAIYNVPFKIFFFSLSCISEKSLLVYDAQHGQSILYRNSSALLVCVFVEISSFFHVVVWKPMRRRNLSKCVPHMHPGYLSCLDLFIDLQLSSFLKLNSIVSWPICRLNTCEK